MVRASILVAAISGALTLAPRPAAACSPPYDPANDLPPCSFVQLWTPAQQFPRQLHGALRVGTFDKRGETLSPQPTFDPNVQVFVHRATASGYEPVAFQLVQQSGLVPNALHLQLADPAPGAYVVSSPQVTCAADPSPAGTGWLVGSFALEPEVPLPTGLGELRWLGQRSVEETLNVGYGGSCEKIDVTARVTHSTLELQLGDAALPWADVLDTAIYVDGAPYYGFAPLTASDQGVATIDLTRICSSSDPTLVSPEAGIGDGLHAIKLVGQIEGLTMIESTETMFALDCAADGDDGWLASGCAAGGTGSASILPLLAIAFATTVRRRGRARS